MANEKKGKSWTKEEKDKLKKLAKGNTPTRLIAMKLERTVGGVISQASKNGISLEPHNRSPYGTGGKGRKRK